MHPTIPRPSPAPRPRMQPRQPLRHHQRHTPLALAGLLLVAHAGAQASTFGSLANFDVVNDTGHTAWGFEIEIEDARYDHAGTISSIFGYDRVFGFISQDPGAVVRYGRPTVDYIAGFGARITYGGQVGGTNFTPSAPFVTRGESCWPGANANWKATSCDHYGVSTYGAPAKTTYRWLLDDGSGGLAKQVVGVPVVNFQFTPPPPPPPPPVNAPPPPPPVPAQVVAVVQAPVVAPDPRANAFWVKMVKTTVGENIDLGDLLAGNHPGAVPEIAAMKDAAEVEIEWQVLQIGKVDEVSKAIDLNGDPAAVWTFQFYKYLGRFDDDGVIDPLRAEIPVGNTLNEFVGDYVGQQIAGFNANEIAPVPEPGTWALMLGGLASLATWVRRRRGRAI